MTRPRTISFTDTHTAGEPTRIVLGGFPKPQGETPEARRRWLGEHADGLRRLVLQEPRGHRDMFGAVICDPLDPNCDAAVFFLESGGYLPMCVHGSIGVTTMLVSTGRCTGPDVVLETPAGHVTCHVHGDGPSPEAVSVRNVPSFLLDRVEVDGATVDVAYGGNLFGLVDLATMGRHVDRSEIAPLVDIARELRATLNTRHAWSHPADGRALRVELIEFYEEGDPSRNLVVFGHGQVDRSPCGTGTSAKLAMLHAKGRLAVDEPYPYRSVLDTQFVGRVLAETVVGGIPAILPEITGSAYVIAAGELLLDPRDPFPEGFELVEGTVF